MKTTIIYCCLAWSNVLCSDDKKTKEKPSPKPTPIILKDPNLTTSNNFRKTKIIEDQGVKSLKKIDYDGIFKISNPTRISTREVEPFGKSKAFDPPTPKAQERKSKANSTNINRNNSLNVGVFMADKHYVSSTSTSSLSDFDKTSKQNSRNSTSSRTSSTLSSDFERASIPSVKKSPSKPASNYDSLDTKKSQINNNNNVKPHSVRTRHSNERSHRKPDTEVQPILDPNWRGKISTTNDLKESSDQNSRSNRIDRIRSNHDQTSRSNLDQNSRSNLDQTSRSNLDQNSRSNQIDRTKSNLDNNSRSNLDHNSKSNVILKKSASLKIYQNECKYDVHDVNSTFLKSKNISPSVQKTGEENTARIGSPDDEISPETWEHFYLEDIKNSQPKTAEKPNTASTINQPNTPKNRSQVPPVWPIRSQIKPVKPVKPVLIRQDSIGHAPTCIPHVVRSSSHSKSKSEKSNKNLEKSNKNLEKSNKNLEKSFKNSEKINTDPDTPKNKKKVNIVKKFSNLHIPNPLHAGRKHHDDSDIIYDDGEIMNISSPIKCDNMLPPKSKPDIMAPDEKSNSQKSKSSKSKLVKRLKKVKNDIKSKTGGKSRKNSCSENGGGGLVTEKEKSCSDFSTSTSSDFQR